MTDWFMLRAKSKQKWEYLKRPFATTPVATSDLIYLLAENGSTWLQIHEQINYDDEAKQIAARFIAEGWGNEPALYFLSK